MQVPLAQIGHPSYKLDAFTNQRFAIPAAVVVVVVQASPTNASCNRDAVWQIATC